MKKNVFYLLVLAVLAVGFVSCSDDDDTKSYDKSNIVGSYEGTCSLSSGTVSLKDEAFPAFFATDSKDQSKLSATLGNSSSFSQIGIFSSNIEAAGFEDHDSYASFYMANIKSEFTGDNVPDFIKNQVSFTIKNTVMELACQNPVKYDIASKTLTFVYKGTYIVTGTESGQLSSNTITYTFNLKKK